MQAAYESMRRMGLLAGDPSASAEAHELQPLTVPAYRVLHLRLGGSDGELTSSYFSHKQVQVHILILFSPHGMFMAYSHKCASQSWACCDCLRVRDLISLLPHLS